MVKNGAQKKTGECDSTPPTVKVDVERYAHMLSNTDMSEDQKRQFLEALWTIIVSFIDLGFGVHPLADTCGQVDDFEPVRAHSPADEVQSGSNSNDIEMNGMAALETPGAAGRREP
ncbi:MAG: hypothetical protein AAGA97_00895 [Pseudomonadota bacterium]